MDTVDYLGAKQYILGRLANELSPNLYYHGLSHTFDDVLPACQRLAEMEGITGDELILLETAVLYHDSGYLSQYFRNEPVGVELAKKYLPKFGYSPAQLDVIDGIIMATQLPQKPTNLLQQIMCDADLDSLGRLDFFIVSQRLRLELRLYGVETELREWYWRQMEFLQTHNYFTPSARSLRNTGKEANIRQIQTLFDALE